jgi:hypothetical protein
MIKNLVVNGCSYMEGYAAGNGHVDLANRLGISNAASLAIGGSANSRIIRTTIKHSHQTTDPTLYIMGLTFISRYELPILKEDDKNPTFEGRWCNPQNQEFLDRYEHYWGKTESEKFVEFKLKTEVYSLLDRTEDLMYTMLSAIDSLQTRGHRVLIFQQADDSYRFLLDHPKLSLLTSKPNIINGFKWCAVGYQHEQGVEKAPLGGGNFIGPKAVPDNMRHPAGGHHDVLNEYLVKYINDQNII